jgi:methionine synthase / methylenetetrahydrofolate reductase (NADH)
MRKAFRTALNQDILLADGAIGTLLVSRGASAEQAKSPLNLTDPAAVSEIHEDYLNAGARILTTNTWDANRVKLTTHEWADSLEKINREGVRLAREVASGEMTFVAGSIGPLGALVKPYGQLMLSQVREIFEEQARALLDAGPDLIILETFGSMLEAAEAVRAVRGLSGEIPIVAQMTFLSDGRTAFGESASHALATLALAGADAVGMNCTLGPQETHDVFSRLGSSVSAPLSVMPNAGYPTVVHGRNVYLSSPDYLSDYAKAFVDAGAAIIGGCCGTTPEHIRSMARAIAGRSRVLDAARVSVVLESVETRVAEPAIETSRLKRRLADSGEFVVTVEVEPPRGVDVTASIAGSRVLKGTGVDAVNVTDNPMARLRMSSIAVAALIQRETGVESIAQITTRDRNILGLQSDQLRRRPRRKRNRRSDRVCRRLRGQPGRLGSRGRVFQAPRQDRGGSDLRADAAGLRRRRARTVPDARGSAFHSDSRGAHSPPLPQADSLLRQRGPRRGRARVDPAENAQGERKRAGFRKGGGTGDRAGACRGDLRALPGDPHHADGQVRTRRRNPRGRVAPPEDGGGSLLTRERLSRVR